MATTRTTTTLAYNTQQITKILAIQPVWCRLWHSESLLHRFTLRFTAAVGSGFCAIVATLVLASITTSERPWAGFCVCPRAIKSCLPRVYPWRHARDKMYQALPLLSGESLGTRLSPNSTWTTQNSLNNLDAHLVYRFHKIVCHILCRPGIILTLLPIAATFLNLIQQWEGAKMQPRCGYPEYSLPHLPEAYQKPLKYGYFHITEHMLWSQWCPLLRGLGAL